MLIDSLESKQKILVKYLDLCVLDGWNYKTLEKTFLELGIDSKFIGLIFSNGPLDIANFWVEEINSQTKERAASLDIESMKIRDKISVLLKAQIDIITNYKLQIRQLISFYSKPKNIPLAFKSAYGEANLMWYLIGDSSTDFNFYSKRIILAKIYIKTLMFFIKDDSLNSQETYSFIDIEIKKVMKFTAFKFKVRDKLKNFTKIYEEVVNLKGGDIGNKSSKILKKLPFLRLYKQR